MCGRSEAVGVAVAVAREQFGIEEERERPLLEIWK
jgi:hypothetical protein